MTNSKMTLIAGPCVIESEGLVLEIAQELKSQLSDLPVELYFKASWDKANRTSITSFRGLGLKEGLKTLEKVKAQTGLPLLSDFHEPDQADPTAEVVDFLQVPAFLCRQTEMIRSGVEATLKYGGRLNIKKGQFMAPWDVHPLMGKARAVAEAFLKSPAREDWLCLTERGTSFGYNQLVVDMVSFQEMKKSGATVLHDATHSIQKPGGLGGTSGGQREYLESLARAAFAAGAEGMFLECHPRPLEALSDGPNAFYLEHVGAFVRQLLEIRAAVSKMPYLLPEARESKA